MRVVIIILVDKDLFIDEVVNDVLVSLIYIYFLCGVNKRVLVYEFLRVWKFMCFVNGCFS